MNVKDAQLNNALIEACRYNHPLVLSRLLEKGVDPLVYRQQEEPFTPLMICALHGHTECAELLLNTGRSSPDVRLDLKFSALYIALHTGHTSVSRLILEFTSGHTAFEMLLLLATHAHPRPQRYTGYPLRRLHTLDLLGDPKVTHEDIQELARWCDMTQVHTHHENTPLMSAALQGNLHMVKLLLPFFNPRHISAAGCTALHRAAQSGSLACIKLLWPLSEPHHNSHYGTLLDHALLSGHNEAYDYCQSRLFSEHEALTLRDTLEHSKTSSSTDAQWL